MVRRLVLVLTAAVAVASPLAAWAQTPRPFPGAAVPRPSESGSPTEGEAAPPPAVPAAPSTPPAAPPQAAGPSDQMLAGTPVYPTAEYIDAFDAGFGQRYYLYGTNMSYDDIVAYYRNVLRDGGREIYREPAMRQFDLGRFREDAMAFPPSVVVKDYSWNGSAGYPAVVGTTEKRFKTVIQIVPPTESR